MNAQLKNALQVNKSWCKQVSPSPVYGFAQDVALIGPALSFLTESEQQRLLGTRKTFSHIYSGFPKWVEKKMPTVVVRTKAPTRRFLAIQPFNELFDEYLEEELNKV